MFQAVTTIARPSSLTKDAWVALKNRGVRIVAADLAGSVQELAKLLTGTDIVISCLHYSPDEEKALATAAKNAGVGRFVPSFWTTVAPRGVMSVRDSVSIFFFLIIPSACTRRHVSCS